MKILSLYCGAGGLDEGLRQAGFKTSLAIDNCHEFPGEDPLETIKLNHPETEIICGNVGDYKSTFGKFDMVIGGPPCPEFSRAKTGRSLNPCEVNNFWEIVESTGAKYWIMENVPDVIKVIKDKKNFLINCADYGVPQTRIRRIFTNLPLPKPTHSEFPTETFFGEPMKKWISVKDALGLDGLIQNREIFGWKKKKNLRDTEEPSVNSVSDGSSNGRWFIEDRKTKYFGETEYLRYSVEKPHHTLITDSSDFFISTSGYSNSNRENKTRSITEPADTVVVAGSVSLTNYEIKSLKKIKNRNPKLYKKHPANVLDASCCTITAKDRSADSMITDGTYARKLTNEELAILQGFPKNYKFHGGKTSVRRQIGNAVPPQISYHFAKGLK